MIQAVLLLNNQLLVTQVYQIDAEPGHPNCRLVDPYLYTSDNKLTRWMCELTEDSSFMIDPSRIVTMFDPSEDILEKYKKIILLESDSDTEEIIDELEENPD